VEIVGRCDDNAIHPVGEHRRQRRIGAQPRQIGMVCSRPRIDVADDFEPWRLLGHPHVGAANETGANESDAHRFPLNTFLRPICVSGLILPPAGAATATGEQS
jgi:hypothetical protein